MNAYESARLLVMLAATGLVSSAGAMELSQSSAPASAEAPGFSLPAFLDGARLPDLQEAWRAHFGFAGEPTAAPSVEPAAAPAAPTDDANLEAARQTLSRAEQLDREAAAVRERAEELSRRFGADASDTAPSNSPASAAPAETASIGSSNAADAAAPVTEQVLAPAGDEAAMVDQAPVPANPVAKASAATDDAPVIEDMATKPAKRAKSEPAPAGRAVQSAARKAAPVVSDFLNVDPAAPKPEADPMMPTELRAFGWNAQP
ncbi:MAG: hypothetical protein K8F92_16200 [Hyphomicrobium sp.]|uniref:hypothetical protein n=1 Tax=Hyphomicrobium sp. TaxID=82 RepID=UPI00132B0265|nr:hypothetical protein [Hyphomicrobium sp.]KAB2939358.1 MAG: hypothetical protein F9K20_17210 [Hyphomicrobium sp.]MBZ0211174.1 hypothetical protein [Hyphomicrobium sp.]